MAGVNYIQPDTGVLPHKDGSQCGNCANNTPATVLQPYYEKRADGTCVPFWRAVKVRADGKFECLGDLNIAYSAGHDVADDSEVCPGYLPAPDKTEPEAVKIYCTGSATFVGPEPGEEPLVFTEADLGLTPAHLITSISFSGVGTNDNAAQLKGGCGPEDCSLVNLHEGDTVSWSEPSGFNGPLFQLTIGPDNPSSTLRDMIEVTYVVCKETPGA